MPNAPSKMRKSQSERAHKPASDTSSKVISSLDEEQFKQLLDRSVDYHRTLIDDDSREHLESSRHLGGGSNNALVENLYQTERRHLIDQQIATDGESSFIRHKTLYAREPSPDTRAPVGDRLTDIDYIDDGQNDQCTDIEMDDLTPQTRYRQGNIEQQVPELFDNNNLDDCETGLARDIIDTHREMPDSFGRMLCGPLNNGLSQGLSEDVVGTDFRPQLTVDNSLFTDKSCRPAVPKPNEVTNLSSFNNNRKFVTSYTNQTYRPNQTENGYSYGHLNNNVHTESRVDKIRSRRLKMKKDNKEQAMLAEEIPGFMGDKDLAYLLAEIEGPEAVAPNKKQNKKDGQNQNTKRRKTKDTKEKASEESGQKGGKDLQEDSVNNNNKENKESELVSKPLKEADAENNSTNKNSDVSAKAPNVNNNKIGNTTAKVDGASSRASLEEDEFVSADEGGAETPCAPSRYQSVAEAPAVTSEVLLDGGNFLADDEDVIDVIKKTELEGKDKFIPVTKGKKGPKDAVLASVSTSTRRNGSISSSSTVNGERRSSVTTSGHSPAASVVALERKGRHGSTGGSQAPMPGTACIADFIDEKSPRNSHRATGGKTKKNTRDHHHHNNNNNNNHKEALTVNTNTDEMAILTSECRPTPQFSYADAAKRTSGEPSPAMDGKVSSVSPTLISPQAAAPSAVTTTLANTVSSAGQQVASTSVPAPSAAPAEERKPSSKTSSARASRKERNAEKAHAKEAKQEKNPTETQTPEPVVALPPTTSNLGISFFYDETAVKEEEDNENDMENGDREPSAEQFVNDNGTLVLHLGDKKITFPENQQTRIHDPHELHMLQMLTTHWKKFQQCGPEPRYYSPRIQTH